MKQAENKSDALWKRMAKLREEVQSGQTALEEMRKSGKNSVKFLLMNSVKFLLINSVKFLFMNLAQVETILSCQ